MVGASARGQAHVRAGAGNQDAWAALQTDAGIAASVADGHGSSSCPRSAVGARLAAVLAADVLSELGDLALTGVDHGELDAALSGAGTELARRWHDAVADHLDRSPFTEDELEVVGAHDGAHAYGTTVAGVLATEATIAVLQVGDGDVTSVREDGTTVRLVPGDPSNVGNHTASLASATARSIRTAIHAVDDLAPVLVWLGTDGFGDAFADADWHAAVGEQLAEERRTVDVGGISAQLPGWVRRPAEVAGDDTTLVLLVRATEVLGDPSPEVEQHEAHRVEAEVAVGLAGEPTSEHRVIADAPTPAPGPPADADGAPTVLVDPSPPSAAPEPAQLPAAPGPPSP